MPAVEIFAFLALEQN